MSNTVQARTMWNNSFFCRQLTKNTTGEEIFKNVDFFFKEHQFSWSDCVYVFANGAPSMMGTKKGFMSFVKKENQDILVIHCLFHRENLAAKEIQEDLAIRFNEVVSVVNYIKSCPLCNRLFRALCDEMGAEHNGLLFHSNIRWLSREKLLKRVARLRNEIGAFLKEQNHKLADRFSDNEWIVKLLFLSDFFCLLNQFNNTMQGRNKIFLDVLEDIVSFQAKMKLRMHRMQGGRIAAFPALNAFVEEEEFDIKSICGIFLEHLTSFLSELDRYIPSRDFCKAFNWVRIPFEVAAVQVHPVIDCVSEKSVALQS